MKNFIANIGKIKNQAQKWLVFGQIFPLLSLVFLTVFLTTTKDNVHYFIVIGWSLLLVASLFWWLWVIKILYQMTNMFGDVYKIVDEIKGEIVDIKNDFKKDL